MGKDLFKKAITKSAKKVTLRHSKPSDAKELIEYLNIIGGESYKRKRFAHNSVLGISVKKDYWSDGIGSMIMKELINFAKQCKVTKTVTLAVNAENKNAIKLYKKFGFYKVGIHKNKLVF